VRIRVDAPKNGLIALQTPRTSRFPTFYYCQVVNQALLRLLSTYILATFCTIGNHQWPHSVFVKHVYYTSNRSWSTRVRFFHSWADTHSH